MIKSRTRLLEALAAAIALSAVGCGASLTGGPQTGSGGLTGTGGLPGTGGVPGTGGSGVPVSLIPVGYVYGIKGLWYPYGDGVGPNASPTNGADGANSDCQLHGQFPASACSQITSPTPGQPFMPTDPVTNSMCTSGIAAQVQNGPTGTPDYADLWGAGIGFNFNSPGGDAGAPGYFDMSAFRGVAFDFSADVLPNMSMRVNFPFLGMHGGDAPYWMGAVTFDSPLTGTTANPQHVQIDWTDVGGPLYLTQEVPPVSPPAFDRSAVQAIQFQVFTNTSVPTPYSFCISNLSLTQTLYVQ
jgi:hypothetical protein